MSDFALQFVPGGGEDIAKKPVNTNIIEQLMSGANTGLASLAGAPVDLMTSALNLGVKGVNKATGAEIPEITDPVGGSGNFKKLVDPFVSDVEPQTGAQRYARRAVRKLGLAFR